MVAGAFSRFEELAIFLLKNKYSYNISVYDGINNCSWNGGRINRDIYWKQSQIDFYYSKNINIALTFSNPIINLEDTIGNELLQKFHKKGNKIILVNDSLRKYIRNKYPKYELIYSITGTGSLNIPMCIEDYNFYKSLETKYDFIVPRMEHIFDSKFLKLDQSKYEIMLNDTCIWNCPYYKQHFEKIAEQNTNYTKDMEIEECWLKGFNPDIESTYKEMDISYSKRKELINRGIQNFKITGRELNSTEYIKELEEYLC